MNNHITPLKFKRSRSQKTNYRFRLKLLLSHQPRLVVRPSLKDVTVQVVEYNKDGDAVRVTVRGASLRKMGWPYNTGSIPAAYLAGFLAGTLAQKKGIKNAILDMGGLISVKGSRAYAVAKGANDAGLAVPCSAEVMPSDERVHGKHIIEAHKSGAIKSKTQFSTYTTPVAKMEETVKGVKEKIQKGTNQ